MLSNQDVLNANKLVKDLSDLRSKLNNAGMYVPAKHSAFVLFFQFWKDLRVDSYLHKNNMPYCLTFAFFDRVLVNWYC